MATKTIRWLGVAAGAIALAVTAACASEPESLGGTSSARPTPSPVVVPAPATAGTAVAGRGTAPAPAEAAADSEAQPEPGQTVRVGSQVGERAPRFRLSLADGSTVSSASLVSDGKPVFLFFHATWCPVCRGELSQLKKIYPDFEDQVAFYAVGADPTEDIDDLERNRRAEGYPWPVGVPEAKMVADFRVLAQSTKVAIGSDGVITYRDGYGRGDPGKWRDVFQELAASAR